MNIEFIGTCASREISEIAENVGRLSSYKNACNSIKNCYPELYNNLALNFFNPWGDLTNIKTIKGVKYLHINHSQIDYLFLIHKS